MSEVQSILTRRLNLQAPEFALEAFGSLVGGSVISASFRGMRDADRQRLLWDALDAEYGPSSVRRVGSLLAFTPEEWDVDAD